MFSMTRRRVIYEGKAKNLYEGPDPNTVIQYFKDDATAGNGVKHAVIAGNAQHSIRITTPYLILDESMRAALRTAALSGVKIDIIVPGKADHHIVWFGSRSYFKELLEVGVNIYDYKGGFLHSKVLIVDDEILSIGTANMDPRSFHHNFEATAMIYHAPTVATAVEAFNEDLGRSEQVTLEALSVRVQ